MFVRGHTFLDAAQFAEVHYLRKRHPEVQVVTISPELSPQRDGRHPTNARERPHLLYNPSKAPITSLPFNSHIKRTPEYTGSGPLPIEELVCLHKFWSLEPVMRSY